MASRYPRRGVEAWSLLLLLAGTGGSCGRGLDRLPGVEGTRDAAPAEAPPRPADMAGPGLDAAAVGDAADLPPSEPPATDAPGAAADLGEGPPGPGPVDAGDPPPDARVIGGMLPPPPVLQTPNGSSCGVTGLGGVRAIAAARSAPVVAVGYGNGQVALLHSDSGMPLGQIQPRTWPVTALAISADGTQVAAGNIIGEIVLGPADGQPGRILVHGPVSVDTLAISADGRHLASGDENQQVKMWRTADGGPVWSRPQNGAALGRVYFLPDGQVLESSGTTATIRRPEDGSIVRDMILRNQPHPTDMAVDGSVFAAYSTGYNTVPMRPPVVGLWPVATGGEPLWVRPHGGRTNARQVLLAPVGDLLAHYDRMGGVSFWRTSDGSDAGAWTSPLPLTSAAFDGTGTTFFVGDRAGSVQLVEAPAGRVRAVLPASAGHDGAVYQVAFSPDGKLFASAGEDREKSLKVWRVSDGALLFTVTGSGSQRAHTFAFSPDSGLIAYIAQNDPMGRIISATDGRQVGSFVGGGLLSVGFSPEGDRVLGGGPAGLGRVLRRFRVSDGMEEPGIGGFEREAAVFAFSPDGTQVATRPTGADTGPLTLWRVADNTPVWEHPLVDAGLGPVGLAFAPNGRWIATSGVNWEPGAVRVIDARDGRLVRSLAVTAGTAGIAFSRDSTLLAFTSQTGVQLYRTSDWTRQGILPVPGDVLALSPTENRLLVSGYDHVLRLFCDVAVPAR